VRRSGAIIEAEVYAIADPSWVEAKGTTPAGLTVAELKAQCRPWPLDLEKERPPKREVFALLALIAGSVAQSRRRAPRESRRP
jgi:hypothetical protein